jgi:hypothetical protein
MEVQASTRQCEFKGLICSGFISRYVLRYSHPWLSTIDMQADFVLLEYLREIDRYSVSHKTL